QPLSGTRCITRETWDACQPLAAGWGVETSLTIDALTAGFWVKEIEAELHHRATGRDLRGQLHRAAQLRDVLRALARRRHPAPAPARPSPLAPEPAAGKAPSGATTAPGTAGRSSADAWSDDDGVRWTVAEDDPAVRAAARRERLLLLPVDGGFSDDQTRQLGDVDVDELNRALRRLPVDGGFAPDDVVFLAGTDLAALAYRLRLPPVVGPFSTEHAVIIASHLSAPEPELPASLQTPLSPDEYTSLVVHAAVEAGNSDDQTGHGRADS